ncbi:Protein kinase-like domain containing protein [Hyaloscypha variabilis]
MSNLRSQIKGIRLESTSFRFFVPELSFYALMQEDAIRSALADGLIDSFQQEELAQRIFQHGRKIFGILVLVKKAASVSKFVEANLLEDAKLPFKKGDLTQEVKLSLDEAEKFEKKQWELLAPVFYRGTLNRRFQERIILPFKQEERIGNGAYGNVYKTVLPERHQELMQFFPQQFARKELSLKDDHQKELKNLAILNQLKHPNIVELLASYTHGYTHNLLFPLAETGSLAKLLATERHATEFESDETLLVALAGLSSGIKHVHDFVEHKIHLKLIGFHHDVRPPNILVSKTDFILADFGLSTFKRESQESDTPFKAGIGDYLAPECEDWDKNFQAGIINRSSDIWSLGGIIAEVATYMAFGSQAIEEFRNERQHTKYGFKLHCFHLGSNQAHPKVGGWLSKTETSATKACAMLVRLARSMLSMIQSERPNATNVNRQLQHIALYQVATTVDDMFNQYRAITDSVDAALEHMRFQAWMHATGILNLDSGKEPSGTAQLTYQVMAAFKAILKCLTQLREDLCSRILQEQSGRHLSASRLKDLNDQLHDFLSRDQQEMFRTYFNLTISESDNEFLQKLKSDDNSISIDSEIRMRAIIKYMTNLATSYPPSKSNPGLIERSAVKLLEPPIGAHRLGLLRVGQVQQPVWIEWRDYTKHGADKVVIGKLYDRVAALTQELSQEKPDAFRTLTCSGFFHDQSRGSFGIIFNIPRPMEKFAPQTLHQLIETTTKERKLWPDLDDKFRLASTLAASLLELHTVGWLHKNFTPSNIVFFPEKHVPKREIARDPFLVGFNYSRPDDPSEFSEGPADDNYYQHPRYFSDRSLRYQHEFDYYSLGVVLIEIAFWMPFHNLTKDYKGSYEARREAFLKSRISVVRAQMGREYFEAVDSCMKGGFGRFQPGEEKDVGAKTTLLRFERDVVARLNKHFV